MHELADWIAWAFNWLVGVLAAIIAWMGKWVHGRLSELEKAAPGAKAAEASIEAVRADVAAVEAQVKVLDADMRRQLDAQRTRTDDSAREFRESIGKVYKRIESLQRDMSTNHSAIMSTLLSMSQNGHGK